jgi:hypothetical protein
LASWLDDERRPGINPWINELGDAVAIVQSTGGNVVCIEMDRAFFKPDVFALASASKLVPGGNEGKPVSVITPRKFGPEKDAFKWKYLLETKRGQVFVDIMNAKPNKYPGLKELVANANDVIATKPDGSVDVRYACVALVDEYGTKKPRTLDERRGEARKVDESLRNTTKDLETTEREYMAFQIANGNEEAKIPGHGRGRKREKFNGNTERVLHARCLSLQASKKRLECQKTNILAALVFFAISLFPGENPLVSMTTFIEIAREYHARWCIENSFRVVKWSFFRRVRSRKPTKRQLALVLGMMLHNFWRVFQMKQIVAFLKSKGLPVQLFESVRPWNHDFPDKSASGLVDPVTVLIRIIGISMVCQVKERIKGGK